MLAFRLEMQKAKHMRYWLMALALAVGQGLWFSWVVSKSQAEQLRQGYMGALQQFPVINTIVMPVLIAVLVSRMCDMEHCGHTFKQLFTMQRPAALFNAKLALCAVYVAAVTVMQGAVILLAGHMRGFLDAPPARHFACFLLSQFSVGVLLAALLQGIALRFHNQFVTLAAGLVLGFLGLMCGFFPPAVQRLTPVAYYLRLETIGYTWDETSRITTYFSLPFSWADYALLWAMLGAVYALGRKSFVSREV